MPELLEKLDRGLRRHLRQPNLARNLLGLGVGVADHECRCRQDEQLVTAAPIAGETALDVFVKLLPGTQGAVPGEDRIGAGGGEVASLIRVACLENHWPALRTSWHVEPTVDVEMRIFVRKFAGARIRQEDAGCL